MNIKFIELEYPSGVCFRGQLVTPESEEFYRPVSSWKKPSLIPAIKGLQLSENFTLDEFLPKTKVEWIRIDPLLISILQELRETVRAPLTITSGYRPQAYNRKVGGSSQSTHINGLAADLYCRDLSLNSLHWHAEKILGGLGGLGFYPDQGFIHIDVRGYKARW